MRWLARAGNGLVTSKILNRTKPTASTAGVSANGATVSVMPATSSMTITPGSFAPIARSARWAAQVPVRVTATRNTTRPARENGTTQRMRTARALPTVPGATGE